MGDPKEAHHEYGVHLSDLEKFTGLDALILAVSHRDYLKDIDALYARVRDGGVVIDVKSVLPVKPAPRGIKQWSL